MTYPEGENGETVTRNFCRDSQGENLGKSLKKLAQISEVSVAFSWTLPYKNAQAIGDCFKLSLLVKELIVFSELRSIVLLIQIGDELGKNLRNVG